ncbi:MAG: zinc-ribbon domain-containing protein [Candidatus Korobacteraceae bacterium]
MPHCTKCGAALPASAQFCQTCGQPQPVSPTIPSPAWQPAPATAGSGMSENTAACLSYVLGWLTGIIFFLIDKRPYVRFHAAQSIVTFGGLHILRIVLSLVFGFGWFFGNYSHFGYGGWGSLGVGIALLSVLSLLTFILWIVCMIKAATGSRFELPIAGPIAQNLAGQ